MMMPRKYTMNVPVALLLVGILAMFGETSAFTTSLNSRRTAVGHAVGHAVHTINTSRSTTKPGYVHNFQLRTQRDDTAVGESNTKLASTKPPPSFLEPGGGPTVTFPADVEEDLIYKQAIERTLLWVALAGVFGTGLWAFVAPNVGEEFFAGYLVEQSLSVDNLFVFLLLFDFFRIPLQYQDKILNWGIYGAIVMRAVMIGLGAVALENFRPVLLVFAGVLVYSSGKILLEGDDDDEEDMNENAIVKFSKKVFDSTEEFDGDNFFTIADGVQKATPLFLCMIAIEISDVVFAVDSIPAVFGVTEVRTNAYCCARLTPAVYDLPVIETHSHTISTTYRTRSSSFRRTCLPSWDFEVSTQSCRRLPQISNTWNPRLRLFWDSLVQK
jgi:predicted tellurium resistance membrane protein TerC